MWDYRVVMSPQWETGPIAVLHCIFFFAFLVHIGNNSTKTLRQHDVNMRKTHSRFVSTLSVKTAPAKSVWAEVQRWFFSPKCHHVHFCVCYFSWPRTSVRSVSAENLTLISQMHFTVNTRRPEWIQCDQNMSNLSLLYKWMKQLQLKKMNREKTLITAFQKLSLENITTFAKKNTQYSQY